jgi:SOS regulatory protein LexA
VREIQHEFGFGSPNSVDRHLKALEREGSIKRVVGKARAFEIPGRRSGPVLRIPLLGSIPAGLAASAFVDADQIIAVDRSLCRVSGKHPLFALRVQGPSMTGASINEGDIAIFEARPAEVGDIIAALIDGEVTLKRLVCVQSGFRLHAEHPDFAEITPKNDLQAQGVLVGIQRTVS